MKRLGTLPGHVLATLTGVVIGTIVALVLGSAVGGPLDPPGSLAPSPAPGSDGQPTEPDNASDATLLLAWASGGLPAAAERSLERLPEVRQATTVRAGIDWLRAPRSSSGFRGAIPLEVAVVTPRDYARFVPPTTRGVIRNLGPGEALLARSTIELRGSVSRLALVDRTLRVRGPIDDVAANGYELVTAGPPPPSWTRIDRFVLVHLRRADDRLDVERRLRQMLRPGQSLRVRAEGETPFLRYGDAVLPQSLIKSTFGEFSARQLPDGRLEVDPDWKQANIRSERVPLIGSVTCHRAILPQLRAALEEVRSEGLGHTIDADDYGGCFSPRFIGLEPRGRLSHHTWGIAIDMNVTDNAFGTKADLDPRLVQIMERHGFTWGGRWLVPDGMHFEWVEFP